MKREARSRLAKYAKEMRKNKTPAEKKLWLKFLREYPIHFSNQIIIGPYIVDFFCKKVRLSIELDGSQHYETKNREYDEIRTLYLEMNGIKELRFPNSYIWEDFDGVCEAIYNEVQKRRNDTITLPLTLLSKKK